VFSRILISLALLAVIAQGHPTDRLSVNKNGLLYSYSLNFTITISWVAPAWAFVS